MKHSVESAASILTRNEIEVSTDSKVILHSERKPGLRLLGAIDFLVNHEKFYRLGPVATASFLKARKLNQMKKEVSK